MVSRLLVITCRLGLWNAFISLYAERCKEKYYLKLKADKG
jgi:hypothetical protein